MAAYVNLPPPTTPGGSDYPVADGWYYSPELGGIYVRVRGGRSVETSTDEPFTSPGGTATGGPAPSATNPSSAQQTRQEERTTAGGRARGDSAFVVFQRMLEEWGLGSEIEWAWGRYVNLATPAQLEIELRDRPAYRTRFKLLFELEKQGLPAMSAAEVLQYEREIAAKYALYDLPRHFWDEPDDFVQLGVNQVSADEVERRLSKAAAAAPAYFDALNADPRNSETMRSLTDFYGVGPTSGEFLAWVLDPQKALLAFERQLGAAVVGGAARRTGFQGVGRMEAERLADLGVTGEEAERGFGQLVAFRDLFTPLPGLPEDMITQEEQLAATFESSATATERIRRRQRQRAAPFEGGGGFRAEREGVTGLGSAST